VKRTLAVIAVAVALTVFLFTPFCGLVHRCGCRFSESRCNISNETGPHCPWCEHRALGVAVLAGVLLTESAVAWATRKKPLATQGAAVAFSLPVAGFVLSALAWLPTDYPHFVVLEARSMLHLPSGPIACHGSPGTRGGSCCHVGGN